MLVSGLLRGRRFHMKHAEPYLIVRGLELYIIAIKFHELSPLEPELTHDAISVQGHSSAVGHRGASPYCQIKYTDEQIGLYIQNSTSGNSLSLDPQCWYLIRRGVRREGSCSKQPLTSSQRVNLTSMTTAIVRVLHSF